MGGFVWLPFYWEKIGKKSWNKNTESWLALFVVSNYYWLSICIDMLIGIAIRSEKYANSHVNFGWGPRDGIKYYISMDGFIFWNCEGLDHVLVLKLAFSLPPKHEKVFFMKKLPEKSFAGKAKLCVIKDEGIPYRPGLEIGQKRIFASFWWPRFESQELQMCLNYGLG
jgi:hypothetical protein